MIVPAMHLVPVGSAMLRIFVEILKDVPAAQITGILTIIFKVIGAPLVLESHIQEIVPRFERSLRPSNRVFRVWPCG